MILTSDESTIRESSTRMAHDVSLFRLYLLRALYTLMAVGIAMNMWPNLLAHAKTVGLMHGVALAMLGAIGVLAAIGIRYPLQMIPLLLFEMTWKVIWLALVGLPLWLADQLSPGMTQTVFENLLGIIVVIAIPWRYVFAHYVLKSGDRWW